MSKYPWVLTARIADTTFVMWNFAAPGFWRNWWTMWRGKRAWALRWYLRHAVRVAPAPRGGA